MPWEMHTRARRTVCLFPPPLAHFGLCPSIAIFIRWGSSGTRMMLVSEGLTRGPKELWQGKALAVHKENIFLGVFPLPRPWQLSAG